MRAACRSGNPQPPVVSLRCIAAHTTYSACPRSDRRSGRWSCWRHHAAAAMQQAQQQQPATTAEALALKQWVLRHAPHPPVDLTPTPTAASGGYGMVTSQEVAGGDLLLSVPLPLFMTQDSARGSALCGDLVRGAALEEWQALLVHLLTERAAGASSFWAPYLAILGDQAAHPLLWAPPQAAWLSGSPLAARLAQRQQQCRDDAATLAAAGANDLPVAVAWRAATGSLLVTPESVSWAAAVLLSRAFCLDLAEPDGSLEGDLSYWGSWGGHGPDTLALVPWADMLAHSSEAGEDSVLTYVPEEGAAQLGAHCAYAPGAQVYDSYGPGLSPGDLLLDYGFVDPANDNHRYDALPSAVLPPKGSRQGALLAALAPLQGEEPSLALGAAGPDLTALTYLRAAGSSDADLVRAGWRLKASAADTELACRVMGRLAAPSNAATEAAVLGALAGCIQGAVAAYPTTLEQDLQELAALTAAADGGSRGEAGAAGASSSSSVGSGDAPPTAADPGGGNSSSSSWMRVQVLRALISEKRALAGSGEVVLRWQQRLAGGKVALGSVYDGLLGAADSDGM